METRTPSGEALTDLILEIFRLNGALLDAGNQLTKPFGLTSARWQVIGAIDHEGYPMTVAQIARRMGLSRQGVQRIVKDLVGLGMLRLEDNQDHKRAPLILLTDKGIQTIKEVNTVQAQWVNGIAANLDEKALKQTLELMQSVQTQMEKPQ